MGTLIRNIALFVLGFSALTFIAFFGSLPAFRNTPIGALHRLLWIHIPKFLTRVDRFVTGGRLVPSVTKAGNYVLFQKHPIVLFLFLGLIFGSAFLFVPGSWPYLTSVQRTLLLLAIPPPFIFTYICQISRPESPHLVSPITINARLKDYPYDHVLYHPNNNCKTCMMPKPARSKHCSLCNACVARCDHHCVWINNCVGRGNYKYFLGLLLFTTVLVAYAAYLAYITLMPQIHWHFEKHPTWYLSKPSGRHDFLGRMLDKFIYGLDVFSTGLLIGGLSRAGVGLLALMTWPLPLGLLSYHAYLVWAGMTTNETGKWSDWREDMADGLVFAADLKNEERHPWPHKSKVLLVRTSDGQMPRYVPKEIEEVVVEDSWRAVWRLGEVENIYDLGFWGNLREVMVN